ncbi:hypothetical protein B0T18DRAFT_392450 [Schizothecium vesticola]|uniref:Ring-like domain-containing protein n=1 Tax=Schizothecium vesticola TaxID=314040 RepID=A0AA40EQN2_9PEZI|nr:hypothetical protein B0T18DRAFT_392450 [Schizothecium vesticola]
MMEYFAYKKFKKNKADKEEKVKGKQPEELPSPSTAGAATPSTSAATTTTTTPSKPTPILDDDDERFLEKLTSFFHDHQDDDDDAPKPTLPPRVATPDISQIWDSDSESFRREERATTSTTTATQEKPAETATKKPNRLSVLLRRVHPSKKTTSTDLVPTNTPDSKDKSKLTVPSPEVDTERDDLTRVLDDLNLSAKNNKAFSLSVESTELLQKFTLVLRDLVNGVPTAVHDLTSLLDDKDGTLADNYEKLPSSLKKLVTQLPEKLTSTLAPELLAVAAEAQGLSAAEAGAAGAGAAGLKGAAKKLMTPRNLKDLVTKPGAVVSMLKGIMNALKLRWPAFIGTNVIWSLALFLLLFVLWYCHKRGREVRLEKEKSEVGVVDGADRIEELPDDLALPAPPTATKTKETPVVVEPASR